MPGEFYFMSLGGLGVSLAGFAGLVAALTPVGLEGSATTKWRIRRIVVWGLQLTFLGFGVIAIYSGVEDPSDTARIASLLAAGIDAHRGWRSTRPGPVWTDEKQRRRWMAGSVVAVPALAVNVIIGSVFYLNMIMLYMLLAPTMIFVAAIRDVSSGATGEDEPVTRP